MVYDFVKDLSDVMGSNIWCSVNGKVVHTMITHEFGTTAKASLHQISQHLIYFIHSSIELVYN